MRIVITVVVRIVIELEMIIVDSNRTSNSTSFRARNGTSKSKK